MSIDEHDYYLPREAANYLRVSVASLRRATRRGDLKCLRVGKLVRFQKHWLDAVTASSGSEPKGTQPDGCPAGRQAGVPHDVS